MKVSSASETYPRPGFVDIKESQSKSPTVEKFFPLVFIFLGLLGIHVAKRDAFGEYRVAKWRFIPLLCLAAILAWSFMQNVVFVSNGNVKLIIIVIYLNYLASTVHLFLAVFLSVWKRNDYCKFLTEMALPTHKPKAQVLLANLLLLAYIALCFYLYPWEKVLQDPLQIVLGVITVLVLPLLPALVDLQACCLISGLVDAHKDLVRNIQENPVSDTTEEKSPVKKTRFGVLINVLPFLGLDNEAALKGSSWVEPETGAIRVQVVRDNCRYLHDLVTQYNKIFSSLMSLRCFLFLIKMMALVFAVMVGYPSHLPKFYLIDEILRFYMVCTFSDNLFQLHQDVEDGVLALQESNNTYGEDRLLYHALASRMSARPAYVSISGTVSMGRGMMAAFINVALTYTIIMFQYKPED